MDAAPALTTPSRTYAPDLARGVWFIVVKLCLLIGREAGKPHLFRLWLPLCRRLCRIARRFRMLMECLAGHPPRCRRGPHTGGAPHPENLLLCVRVPASNGGLLIDLGWEAADLGWHLEQILAEPRAAEILAKVPAAARILWPLRNMFGLGPFDVSRRRFTPANPRPVQQRPRPSVPRRRRLPSGELEPLVPDSVAAGRNSAAHSAGIRPTDAAPRRRRDPDPPLPADVRSWAFPPTRKPP